MPVGDVRRARTVMASWRAATERALAGVDVLSGPVFHGAPPTIAEVVADYEQDQLRESPRLMRFTPVANALGWPAMAVPTADGPRHLLGRPGYEPLLLAIAERIGLHRRDVVA